MKWRIPLTLSLLCACAGGSTLQRAGGGGLGYGARSEHVVIGMHADISAVAASRALVFAATPDALLMYDTGRASWLPPLTRADGYPGGPATIIAADPVEDGVWLAAFGTVLYYRPSVDLVTSAILPGVADALFFDRRDPLAGAYVRSGGRWALIGRTGTTLPIAAQQLPPPVARDVPPTLSDVYHHYPTLRSFAALLTRDARLQSWPVSSGSRAPDRDEVFLGTRGNGLFRVDPIFQSAEHLPYGLLEQGAASIALSGDGVWIGGSGASTTGRGGVTYASHDLQRWLWFEGPPGRPLGRTRVNAVSSHGSAIWIGTERGVFQLDATAPDQLRQWTMAHGLPSDLALAVLPGLTGTWIGTARGLALIPPDAHASGERELRAFGTTGAIRSLVAVGERLWIGSDAGLLTLNTGDPAAAPERAAATAGEVRLRRPILAIAASDSMLFAATADEVFAIDSRSDRVGAAALPGEGAFVWRGITALAADPQTVWLGGSDGVRVISRATGASRELRTGRDVPAEVTGIALAPGVAWIATRRGVVRLARQADGGIR